MQSRIATRRDGAIKAQTWRACLEIGSDGIRTDL
jgi:hypothetical protein